MMSKEEKPIMIIRNLTDKDIVKPYIELNKALIKEKDELEEKLAKYKRVFEILKSKEIFEFKDDNCLYLNAEDHNWWGDIIESSFVRLSDEEYELLEELMKSEEIR